MTRGEIIIILLIVAEIANDLFWRWRDHRRQDKIEEKADEVVEVLEQIADGVNENEEIVEEMSDGK